MASNLTVDTIRNSSGDAVLMEDGVRKHGPGQIIETLSALCDGQSYTVTSGTYTTENVTAKQSTSTSYVDLNGSTLTYTPPAGTSIVTYEFFWLQSHVDQHGIIHYRFYIDDVEVTDARVSETGGYEGTQVSFHWTIPIGGTANTATGRQAIWTSGKQLKIKWRDYGTGNEGKLHVTHWWDGATSEQFHRPQIKITAYA